MTILKYLTGLAAVFLVTIAPMIVKAEDICMESSDRAETYVSAFVDGVARKKTIGEEDIKELIRALAVEPDIYEIRVTAGIGYPVPGGGNYFVNLEHEQIMTVMAGGEKVCLNEGDTVTVRAAVISPSVFSRITGRYDTPEKREARSIRMGCRVGRS